MLSLILLVVPKTPLVLDSILRLKHSAVQVVILEPKVSNLVLQISNLRHQLALACLVVGLHLVIALMLHLDSSYQHLLLPLLLEKGIVGSK